ncbi:MAG: pimeloyl-ACP methyl ester carboxylesterase [Myxococcota bacterium]|jgi:pimeloyl-ACP methyl ester carboxylesterase
MLTHSLRSFDGTRLTVFEGGNPDGPPIVLANGLGGNVGSWRHLIAGLGETHRILCWDYRGLYASDPAVDGVSYAIEHHALDLAAVIDGFELESPTLCGWSMGVQVSLEFLRNRPNGAGSMIAINGTPGHPFRTAFGANLHAQMQRAFAFSERHWMKATWALPYARRKTVVRIFMKTVQVVGLANSRLDAQVFKDLAFEFAELDIGVYSRIFNHLGEHDATDVLPHVQVPALLIGGDRDKMTPLHRTLLMAARIPNSELVTIRGGTHFSPVEFPNRINREISRFLEQNASASDSEVALAASA